MLPPPAEKLQNFFGVFLQFQIGVDTRLSIREQMAAYKEVIDRSSLEAERKHPETGRDER